MISVGIPKEFKVNEYRVSMTPNDVSKLVSEGICVYVQLNAGIGANFSNKEYVDAGAVICKTIEDVYKFSTLIVKVKEPQPEEYELIKEHHIIFTFFHFASSIDLMKAMIDSKATCIAYETLRDNNGKFPILAEMSKIAGEQSIIEANKFRFYFMNNNNYDYTSDIITIIGIGNVGKAAAYKSKALNYKTINLIDRDYDKIKDLEKEGFNVYEMNNFNLSNLMMKSDIVVGSIYVDGEKAKKLIINDLLVLMQENSIFMDVAIDQGGMTEKSKPTTITNPLIKYHKTYIYCVPNIPSRVPNEASINLSKVITPYVLSIANEKIDDIINTGININNGKIIHQSLIGII